MTRPILVLVALVVGLAPSGADLSARQSSGMWGPIANLTSASITHGSLAANGTRVVVCQGDGQLYCRSSNDEGASIGPWSSGMGTGQLYLERPMHAVSTTIAALYVNIAATITDLQGQRQVGNIRVRRQVNGTWLPAIGVTEGTQAFRLSLLLTETAWHLVYMNYTTRWNIDYVRSVDAGATWSAPVTLSAGLTPQAGDARPTIVASGNSLHVAFMSDRWSNGTPVPCEAEGGATLFACTEIYHTRSLDQGVTWDAAQRLTTDVAYSGRPDLAAHNGRLFIAYDHRVAGSPDGNEIGLLTSLDNGSTWTQSLMVTAPNDQTHGTMAAGPRGLALVWMDKRSGSYHIFAKHSTDGVTWGAEEQISTIGNVGAPSLAWSANALHVAWAGDQPLRYRRKVWSNDLPPDPCVTTPLTLDWTTVSPSTVLLLTDPRGCTTKRP